jgi:hypothetical protein
MPGPDIHLKDEMKRSGMAAICMTFATDYQPATLTIAFSKDWHRWIGGWSTTA